MLLLSTRGKREVKEKICTRRTLGLFSFIILQTMQHSGININLRAPFKRSPHLQAKNNPLVIKNVLGGGSISVYSAVSHPFCNANLHENVCKETRLYRKIVI